MELVLLDSNLLPQEGFVDGTSITEGVRCVVNNQSLLDMTHIIFKIKRVMANTHPKSPSKKSSVVGLPGKKNGKSEEVKTPGGKKLKVLPIGVGVVTGSPPNVMSKLHHSNESKTLSLQSMGNHVSSVTKKLVFTGKHKVQRSPNHDPKKRQKSS